MTTSSPPIESAAVSTLEGNSEQSTAHAGEAQVASAPTQAVWVAPSYSFSGEGASGSGVVVAKFQQDDSIIRSARWCIDGSTIFTTSDDRRVRLYTTPQASSLRTGAPELAPYLDSLHAAPLLASIWYPTATPSVPEGFCFAATVRDGPVRLIDATTGHIRATYPIVDHRERFIAPYSLAWNPSATKLYCGHENAIEIIDISSPGYDNSERIKTTLSKKDKGGQKGIISALAFSTDYSGLYAAGSFSGSVSLYSEDESGTVGHLEGVEGGGVTQLAFHPLSPNHLFVASRRSSSLQVFDLRNPSQPYHLFPRLANTNQRMSFDLDPWGRYLGIGDEAGKVSVWDVGGAGQWGEKAWEAQFADAEDAISSVQFHPLEPLLLVSSGSRHVDLDVSDSDSEESSDDESSADGEKEVDSVNDIGGSKAHKSLRRAGLQILSFAESTP